MKIFTVDIYKTLEDGETGERKTLKIGDRPAVFETSELAYKVGVVVISTLDENMLSKWNFTVLEGELI